MLLSTIYSLLNLTTDHLLFADKSSILRESLQTQLVHDMMGLNISLPYSEKGEFIFCNLQSWDKNDNDSLKTFAVDQTTIKGGNIT
jgi:hypothetical protein